MQLIADDYSQVYVWVDCTNPERELSPRFDYEEDAMLWRDRIAALVNSIEQ